MQIQSRSWAFNHARFAAVEMPAFIITVTMHPLRRDNADLNLLGSETMLPMISARSGKPDASNARVTSGQSERFSLLRP